MPATDWLAALVHAGDLPTPCAAQCSASSKMQTTVASVFFASATPSAPKWSECPWVAAMTSSLP